MIHRRPEWIRAALILAVLALLIAVALREALTAGGDRLPGIDAGVHYAWEVYTRSVLHAGRLPHWDPYLFGGMPHLANSQNIVLYPPAMLLRWLAPPAFLTWMAALHLWIGGAGAYFLARVIGIGRLGAAAAAVAVALGGSAGPWLHNGHLLNLFSAAWLPWALACAVLSARRGTMLPHPGLPVVLVLQFLAGHPQGSIYTVAAVCGYFLFCVAWPEHRSAGVARWRPLVQLVVVALLTAALGAFQLIPLARLLAEAGRTGGIPFQAAIDGQWAVRELASFVYPFIGPGEDAAYRPLADRIGYVGLLLLCVAPAAVVDRRDRRWGVFFGALAVCATALALGDNLPFYRLHYALFPGLRVPGRLLFIATVSLAVIGALGLERFVAIVVNRQWRRLGVSTTAAVAALAGAAAAAASSAGSDHVRFGLAWPWLPLIALTGIVFVGVLAAAAGARAALVAGLLIVALDVTPFAAGAIETIPLDSEDTLRRWLGPPHPGRAVSLCENRIGDGALLVHERPALRGPGAVYLRDYAEWLAVLDSADRPSDVLGPVAIRRDLLNAANVTTVIACEPLQAPALTLVSSLDSIFVYRNDAAWPRAVWSCHAPEMARTGVAAQLRRGRFEDVGRLVYRPVVSIRWASGLQESDRLMREGRYQLGDARQRDGTTWQYVLHEATADNIAALLRDEAIEDTHGLDRSTGTLAETNADIRDQAATASETAIGTSPCIERGSVKLAASDRPDGWVAADVEAPIAGVVFFSEPYYPERQAFVDGVRVTPLKANLAFTAVPVPPGRHRVELRHVPTSFYTGAAITGTTLLAWSGIPVLMGARRRHADAGANPAAAGPTIDAGR